ncbi:MAG TPA: ATP synthase F1 subunit delta [Miltoncostaeaceae bacterium]|nr:ATP synthase F1 subunit delta [Miltoncostaeaceae bacterium]
MSVATTYAEALHEAADAADALEPVAAGIAEFAAAFAESAELRAVLADPQLDTPQKSRVVGALAEGAHPQVVNFLRLLVDRGRILELPQIADAFEELVARAEGRLNVEAITAVALPADLREQLSQRIASQTGRSITLSESVDPEILGGLVLKVGQALIDGSVRSRLDQLRQSLTAVSVDAAVSAD